MHASKNTHKTQRKNALEIEYESQKTMQYTYGEQYEQFK